MPNPPIKGFLETSFLDWPGRLCAVLFLGGCNFRCPFCHNHPLVLSPDTLPNEELSTIRRRLQAFRHWLGGVCVTGGEPTLHPGLPTMLAGLKSDGWQVKLDTNGSRPRMLADLLSERLVDMVAMDIKAPLHPDKYRAACGTDQIDLAAIAASIAVLRHSGRPHQFRMTVVPALHSENDIMACAALAGPAGLTLQNFNPATTLDPQYARHSPFSAARFAALRHRAKCACQTDLQTA